MKAFFSPLVLPHPDISTGCCTIFVEEDGTRTMCTFLGAGTLIGPEDIKEKDITNHKIAYLEGYLWDNENAKQAMKKMVSICKSDNQQIAFTLSDLFCVDRHRKSFSELIKSNVDILFGNEEEILALAQVSSMVEGIEFAKSLGILTAITLAEKGSLIVHNNEVIEINPEKVEKFLIQQEQVICMQLVFYMDVQKINPLKNVAVMRQLLLQKLFHIMVHDH